MPDYGITPTGFVIKPLPVIEAEMAAAQRQDVAANLNTSAGALAGIWNGIIAARLHELWELEQAAWNADDPNGAEDADLDQASDLTGTRRRAATKGRVDITLNLDAGITVPAGSIVSQSGNPDNRWVLLTAVTSTGSGNYSGGFEAETVGAIAANSGTLTVIDTPVSGWNSATNSSDATPGLATETDPELRLRRVQELAAVGGGTVDGMLGDISKVDEVTAVVVLENFTDAVDANGLPPHSFEVVAAGYYDADDIAQQIWDSKPAGVRPYGALTGDATDSQGNTQTMSYSQPTARRVYAALDLVVNSDEYAGDAAVKAAIVAAAELVGGPAFLGVGADIYASQLVTAVLAVDGVIDAVMGLAFTSISDPDSGTSSLAIGGREQGTLDTGDIAITGVPA